jgi:hypothetical protein
MRLLVLALLALLPGAPAQTPQAPEARLRESLQRLQALQEPWYLDFRAARGAVRTAMLDEVPGREIVPELEAVAESAAGTPVALRARARLFGLAKELRDEELAARTLARITAEHLESPELESLCTFIGSWSRPGKSAASEAALRAMIAGSPHRSVRAAAHFNLAVILAQAGTSPTRADEARAHFVALRDEYGDLGSWKEAAVAGLYELEHLQVGMPAPDFEAIDQQRASFRLSDARGRVVLLHFFGFW